MAESLASPCDLAEVSRAADGPVSGKKYECRLTAMLAVYSGTNELI